MNEHETSGPYLGYTTSTSAPAWEPPPAERRRRRGPGVHILLFGLTFLTTSFAGALHAGVDPLAHWSAIRAGFPFAVTLLTILLCHEMGHYFLARYHQVEATLPYFIPAPPLIGTFGAFIRMKSPPPSRNALFDVGAAGPWAGVIIAIPAIIIGLRLSEVRPAALAEAGDLTLAEPVLFSMLSYFTLGPLAPGMDVFLHPVALAGWIGLLVTFINLIPVGQLDGGHVAYAFLGRRHRLIARAFFGAIVLMAIAGWSGWFLWVILLLVVGLDHPPTLDNWTPLDRRRRVASWMTALLFASTFMAQPISVAERSPIFEGEMTEVSFQVRPKPPARGRLFLMRPALPPKGIPL
jgi:membrane-associated protease RseP (regulator of RpoE activity)